MKLFDAKPAEELIDRHRKVKYPYRCRFGEADLIIDEGVFCPTLTQASPLLLEYVEFKAGERALDVFERHGGSVEELCRADKLEAILLTSQDMDYEHYRVHKITRSSV